MSVNTSEEYLDELLQSVEPIIYMNDPVLPPEAEEQGKEEEAADKNDNLLDNLVEIPSEKQENENSDPESISVDDLLASFVSEQDSYDEEETDVDAMINAAATATAEPPESSAVYDADVKALLQQFKDDEDLADIGEILERNDNNEAVDESILTTPETEIFQPEEETEEIEETPLKEEKGFWSFLKKKLHKKDKSSKETVLEEDTDSENCLQEPEEDFTDQAVNSEMEIMPDGDLGIEMIPETDLGVEIIPDMDLAGEEVLEAFPESETESKFDLEGMDLNGIFEEEDRTDIDQILSAGLFENLGVSENPEVDETKPTEKKPNKKDNKKESFFTKLFRLLTEEAEETQEDKVPEASATGITDENQAILEELSKEEKKKRKKEEKEQKKKEKQAKKKGKEQPEGEESEEGEENSEKKNKKDKKKKKSKKEKVSDLEVIPEKPQKKLSKKKVMPVFALCFSILTLILIVWAVLPGIIQAKEARWAFDNADYETCYGNLYGEKRSEKEEEIFQKSYIVLCVQRKWDSYENFRQMGMEVEALDALFEGVRVYRDMEAQAESYGVLSRITPIFETIYAELRNYGLSEAEIEEILAYESKVAYTKRLESIVSGTPFVMNEWLPAAGESEMEQSESQMQQAESDQTVSGLDQDLEDVLPMEEDFLFDDTTLLNEENQVQESDSQDVYNPESLDSVPQQEQGNTVVVGSHPVDISGSTQDTGNLGGTNIGSGSTNISAEVDGNNVFVN